MAECKYENLKKMSIKVKKKQKMRSFFRKYVWLNWIKVNSSIVSQIEFCTVVQKLPMILRHNKTVLDGLNLLVSVSKFGIDTTKNTSQIFGVW